MLSQSRGEAGTKFMEGFARRALKAAGRSMSTHKQHCTTHSLSTTTLPLTSTAPPGTSTAQPPVCSKSRHCSSLTRVGGAAYARAARRTCCPLMVECNNSQVVVHERTHLPARHTHACLSTMPCHIAIARDAMSRGLAKEVKHAYADSTAMRPDIFALLALTGSSITGSNRLLLMVLTRVARCLGSTVLAQCLELCHCM